MPGVREELLDRIRVARRATDALFGSIAPEALYDRPIAERHRLLFYVGHVDAFDWNLLVKGVLGAAPRHPELETLFAFGIDPDSLHGALPADRPSDWPRLERVRRWVAELREDVDAALARAPLEGWLEDGWAARIAIEHRLMHAETLAYGMSRLPLSEKKGGAPPRALGAEAPPQRWLDIPEGRARLGLARSDAAKRGWDNEYEAHDVDVPAFRIDAHKVTNGEFLEFVRAGGYRERSLWSDEAWTWLERSGTKHPAFWKDTPGGFVWMAMFAEVPLALAAAWPVWVSHAEASAYARWRGARLPTEAEWHRAAQGAAHGNLGEGEWDPAPVETRPMAASVHGVDEPIGNGWEWTSTSFAPFDGFEPLPFYRGYSANFFDGRHFVMKGASPRTARGLARLSFRNWFQPHYPYVYAGFRCVEGKGTS